MSSLCKKYVMALTGFILVGFVIGHMLGNLQMFLHPDWINEYAYKLQHMPYGLLWVVRLVLLVTVVLHIVTAVLLVLENKKARPESYAAKAKLQSTYASMTMRYSGIILAAFIVFHILHFTTRNIHPEFKTLYTELQGVGTIHGVFEKLAPAAELAHMKDPENNPSSSPRVHDVHTMVVQGFSSQYWYVVVFYLVAMVLLCLHLRHGISSMFQSLGLRNAIWRRRLDDAALVIALVVLVGFISIPVAVITGLLT